MNQYYIYICWYGTIALNVNKISRLLIRHHRILLGHRMIWCTWHDRRWWGWSHSRRRHWSWTFGAQQNLHVWPIKIAISWNRQMDRQIHRKIEEVIMYTVYAYVYIHIYIYMCTCPVDHGGVFEHWKEIGSFGSWKFTPRIIWDKQVLLVFQSIPTKSNSEPMEWIGKNRSLSLHPEI